MPDIPSSADRTGRAGLCAKAAVLFAVAVLTVLPLSLSSDSEALTEAEAGYVIDIGGDASDSEIAAVGLSKEAFLQSAVAMACEPFETDWIKGSDTTSVSSIDSFDYRTASAERIHDDTFTEENLLDVTYTGFRIIYTFEDKCDMFLDQLNENQRAAAIAIYEKFGVSEFSKGDTVEFTGDYRLRYASESSTVYGNVDGSHSVVTDIHVRTYQYLKYDITAKLERSEGNNRISVEFEGSGYTDTETDTTSIYAVPLEDLSEGEQYALHDDNSVNKADTSAEIVISKKTYDVTNKPTSGEEDYNDTVVFLTTEDIAPDISIPTAEPSANVSIDKTYSAASDAYDELVEELTDEDGIPWILYVGIGLGTLVAAVLAALGAVYVLKKKGVSRSR